MQSSRSISPSTAKAWLADRQELAFLDVREAGEFASGHPLFATSLPFSILEARLPVLVPLKTCRIVFLDDGHSGRATRAAEIASGLGYTNVFVLEGGALGWRQSGFTLFEGVYVPSKAFGELIETAFCVPHLSARELDGWRRSGKPFVVLDGRPPDEHRRMNIPGSICLPNGELPYRIGSVIPDQETPVVIHCAGRTRSIVGAQILRDLGLRNPVFALENGTQGWMLQGLELERGSDRIVAAPEAAKFPKMRIRARHLGEQWRVPFIDRPTADEWLGNYTRTTYLLDVRSEKEFRRGHMAGAIHAPGGQLLQSTDQWVAVRRGRIILCDDTGLRAVVVARYLRMMDLDCSVLPDADNAAAASPSPPEPAYPQIPLLSGPLPDEALILDTRSSMAYRSAHIVGATWVLRHQLNDRLEGVARTRPVVLCGDDQDVVRLIAADLKIRGFDNVSRLQGHPRSWREAGLEVTATPDEPSDEEALDFVFFTHDRHSGNLEAARRYLSWETGLVARLDADELAELTPRTDLLSRSEVPTKRLSSVE